MAFCCGCEIIGGEPISPVTIKAHYKHTMEALIFWELLRRPGTPQGDDHIALSQARINLIKAIDKLYPEAGDE